MGDIIDILRCMEDGYIFECIDEPYLIFKQCGMVFMANRLTGFCFPLIDLSWRWNVVPINLYSH